ncbi:hypothetical protein PHYPSEUDO_007806 [Phytophthora pseudosyringae]|uniref:Uncharacterized protein n=1 Tax=Phytophthora pseudosyringae TaxID=221518 RepID=A0A8T1VIM3_9STRA|nr:hypothetical protein PHYPSEUDO_007806 [Phytophthora pseudosyringae]
MEPARDPTATPAAMETKAGGASGRSASFRNARLVHCLYIAVEGAPLTQQQWRYMPCAVVAPNVGRSHLELGRRGAEPKENRRNQWRGSAAPSTPCPKPLALRAGLLGQHKRRRRCHLHLRQIRAGPVRLPAEMAALHSIAAALARSLRGVRKLLREGHRYRGRDLLDARRGVAVQDATDRYASMFRCFRAFPRSAPEPAPATLEHALATLLQRTCHFRGWATVAYARTPPPDTDAHFAFSPGASKQHPRFDERAPDRPHPPPQGRKDTYPFLSARRRCMHNSSDREQLDTGLQPDSADRGSELYRQRRLKRSHQLMNSQDDGGFAALSSPRGEQQQLLCKYKSGKCSNPRATKRNGQLHTLCHFHRDRQNEHQRKSDRKHRMVSVARRAKLGSIGVGSDSARRHSLHSITSLEAAFPSGSAVSPLNRFGYDQNASDAFRNAQYAAGGVPSSNNGLGGLAPPPAGTTRLPPISFLMPGKLDGYRATSTAVPNLPPSSFLTDSFSGNAGKTA